MAPQTTIDTAQPAAAAPPLSSRDDRLGAWRGFLQAHARLVRRLDTELRAAHGISLPEYEALLHLGRSPDRRLRMTQLASQVLLSKSGVTRLVDRLVVDGLVERSQCPTDARGAEAVLTPAGLERLRSAADTHLEGVDRYFVSAVDPADLAVIDRAMDAISRRAGDVDPDGNPASDACDPTEPGP
jgi:DNA-binding MarR family transcriptional regulator